MDRTSKIGSPDFKPTYIRLIIGAAFYGERTFPITAFWNLPKIPKFHLPHPPRRPDFRNWFMLLQPTYIRMFTFKLSVRLLVSPRM